MINTAIIIAGLDYIKYDKNVIEDTVNLCKAQGLNVAVVTNNYVLAPPGSVLFKPVRQGISQELEAAVILDTERLWGDQAFILFGDRKYTEPLLINMLINHRSPVAFLHDGTIYGLSFYKTDKGFLSEYGDILQNSDRLVDLDRQVDVATAHTGWNNA